MDRATDLRSFVTAAREAGQDYREVETLLLAANWPDVDQFPPALWEELANSPQPAPVEENTSGTSGPVPPEVAAMGFCWGAFGMTWIWGAINQVPAAFVLLALPVVGLIWRNGGVVLAVALAVLAGSIWLGSQGHRLAWRNRRFDSPIQFHHTMREWNRVGLFLFALEVVSQVVRMLMRLAR